MSIHRKHRQTASTARSAFEPLEGRLCQSTVSYIGGLTQQLTVTGTEGADNVRIVSFDLGKFRVFDGTLQIWQGDDSLVKKVIVDLKGGNDNLQMTSGTSNIYQDTKTFDIKLGNGFNVMRMEYGQTNFYDNHGYGGHWAVNITGGSDTDDITANMGRRFSATATLTLTAKLGGGADSYTGSLSGNTDDGLTRTTIYGEAGADTINCGANPDYVDGGSDNDIIRGGVGNDTLFGNGGLDQLFGEAGNDSLDGGGIGLTNDRDTLTGGEGRDGFVQYRSGPNGAYNQDLITDAGFLEYVRNYGQVLPVLTFR